MLTGAGILAAGGRWDETPLCHTSRAADTMTTAKSPHSVGVTTDRAVAALARRGIELFARVDHGGGARRAGLELADEELLIFGDPRVGTLLMQSDPRVGYELPLRLLVWDDGGQTMVGYRPAVELAEDYELAAQRGVLENMDGLLAQILAESITPE
jgi:uncharacterized protein (DUF302 family)